MEHTFGEPLKLSICLSDRDEAKLKNFVTDLDSDYGELYFIVLEGDCIVVSIKCFTIYGWDKMWYWVASQRWPKFGFAIDWFHVNKYGQLEIFGSANGNMKECLSWITKHISPYGVLAVEDSRKLETLLSDYPFVESTDQILELRARTRHAVNRSINLESLTKRVIRSNCVELDTLSLPRKIIEYLKQ